MPHANPTLFLGVDGTHEDLVDPKASFRREAEQVVRVSVAPPQTAPVDRRQRPPAQRHVAALGVGDRYSERNSGCPGERPVPEPSVERHRLARARPAQTIPFEEVCLVLEQGTNHRDEILGSHLSVGCNDDRHVRSELSSTDATRRDRCANASIQGVRDQIDRAPGAESYRRGGILTSVIDEDDLIHLG